ncbi:tail fiber domain-containing protein [Pseudoalteromonas spongiae]|uniref:tail fiber domain-containing protein n=1 Tax=Pseudoalteromonas spongiae TaxID=298657 RepID=UPI000C2D2B1B|nr:tail fiber domain-containing protein [Pseudoalteromonas spongiae]
MKTSKLFKTSALSAALFASVNANADQQILDDLIVTFSVCVGNDCVNGENFGFDTLRLKENNLRLHFQDTSNSASFPSNDWRIVANDSSNGGANYLAIEDSTAGRIPFRVEAGAPANALYVEADGDIGIKTANPAVDLHVVEGNTPTLRLEQDGSDGFTAQTWDIAGNEANFFVRDVTNGSKLSFRIRPGAPESALDIAGDGDIGIGTSSPDGQFDVAHSSNANNHAFLIDPSSNVGVNIDNGYTPSGLFDVQTTGGVSRLSVSSSGRVNAATPFGSASASDIALLVGEESRFSTYFLGHTINSGLDNAADDANLVFNYKGHQAGTSYFRDTLFFDGKANLIGGFDGSGAGLALGQRDATNILTVVQGSATDPIADAWTTYSSRRWKTNIQTIENAIEKVMSMRGVTYDWKNSGKSDIGFIAEEVGEILPEIVAYEKNGVDAKSVDYSRVVPLLIEAIKAQQVELELLQKIVSESN